jgi:hypothetical protein
MVIFHRFCKFTRVFVQFTPRPQRRFETKTGNASATLVAGNSVTLKDTALLEAA